MHKIDISDNFNITRFLANELVDPKQPGDFNQVCPHYSVTLWCHIDTPGLVLHRYGFLPIIRFADTY